MNEYEETQAGRELSESDEIVEPDFPLAAYVVDNPDGTSRQATEAEGNVMHALTLYWLADHWVYDDPRFGRTAEPLVLGASDLLDQIIVFDLGTHTRNPVNVVFSGRPFPRAHMGKMMNPEDGGFWYSMEGREAWLCPALLDYFTDPPPELFVRVVGHGKQVVVGAIARAEALSAGDPDWAERTRWELEPKDPGYHSVAADIWDSREGK
jgi:hypothetical protein